MSTLPQSSSIKSLQIGMHWFPERAGGLDRMYYSLVGALPGAGVAVRGVVAGSGRVAADTDGAIRGFGSAAQSLPRRMMAARRALREVIRHERPDVVSSHFALYTFPGLDVTRGIPQVSHFQGPWADESQVEGADSLGQRAKRYLEQTVYARSSRLIVLSSAFAEILTSRYGIARDKVRIVPGCVDTAQFDLPITQAEARRKLQLPQGRPIVLAVRRLVRRMGLEDLIDAVDQVRRRHPDILLLIAGKGQIGRGTAAAHRRGGARRACEAARLRAGRAPGRAVSRRHRQRGADRGAGGLRADHGGIAGLRHAGAGHAGGRPARGRLGALRGTGAGRRPARRRSRKGWTARCRARSSCPMPMPAAVTRARTSTMR